MASCSLPVKISCPSPHAVYLEFNQLGLIVLCDIEFSTWLGLGSILERLVLKNVDLKTHTLHYPLDETWNIL